VCAAVLHRVGHVQSRLEVCSVVTVVVPARADDVSRCRIIAQEKGFILNEYALTPVGESGVKGDPLPVASEQGTFVLASGV